MTTTEMTATGGEMVLLAMLPEESRVMLVQTSRLQTVGDLEDFIVDEYARVFPHLPPLSRGLRLQKCVSPELVLDRRAHTAVHQEASHRFVDLAKNVQAGNVFHNMEQIYIVTHAKLKPKKALVAQPTAIVAREEEEKSEAQGAQKPQAPEKIVEAVEGGQAAIGTQSNDSAKEKVPGRNEKIVEKERHAPSKTSAGIESRVKEKNVSGSVTKAATKETADAKKHVADESTGGRKKVVAKQSSEKADLKYKSTKAGTEQKSESKKTGKKETNDVKETKKKKPTKIVAETNEKSPVKKAAKKAVPKKSENALLKKMLAAKQSASTAGSPSVTSALQTSDADSQDGPSKKQRARKASETEASSVEVNQEPAEEPPLKKKKSVKLAESSKTASKLVDDETGTAERSTNKKAAAANDKIRAVPKKKATVTVEIQPKINDDSSTASETTKIGQKSKKKAGAKSDDVEKPVAKRAKKGESLKTSAVKKTTEKVMPAVKVATPETESSHGSQSSNHEVVSGEETEAVETPVSKKKATGKLKEIGELKGFKKIMAETSKRIAATKEASGARNGSVEPEQGLKQSVKSVDSTASESSVDSDHSSIVGKRVEHSPEKATFVESDSFSSSDEEGLNYSQSLLADLTKNDKEDGLIASENGEKSKQVDRTRGDPSAHHSQDTEQSQDMPSSELTQKPQESNSVLLRSLSRNRFSLGSMPVAKLKKSSKNPFKKAKADTSSAADRPRGRPRKVELE